jgi:acyl carrier protein
LDIEGRDRRHPELEQVPVPDIEAMVINLVRTLLDRREGPSERVHPDAELVGDLDLDSLELAELSATLEDDMGTDPYSAGLVPRTVGDVIAFYAS